MQKHTTEQKTQVQEITWCEFAGNGILSFNGNSIEEYFDKFLNVEPQEEQVFSLKVFEYHGKFY